MWKRVLHHAGKEPTGAQITFQEIRKRDGRVVPFDADKITEAILRQCGRLGAATGRLRKT